MRLRLGAVTFLQPMSTRRNRLVFATVAAVVSAAVSAQTATEYAQRAPGEQLREQIAALRATEGPAAAGLIGPLHILALVYQEAEDHVLASAAFEEARYVTRVHRGLFSVDEALLLEQQIRSEKALRNYERAWNLGQDMLAIARKHLDDVRVVPIFRALADDRSAVLSEVRAGSLPTEIRLGCYLAGPRPRYEDPRGEPRPAADGDSSCRFGRRDVVVARLREEILLYLADAIEVMLEHGDYASGELRELERQALGIEYFAPYWVLPSMGNATSGAARFTGVRLECPDATLDALLASDLLDGCLDPVIHWEGHVVANVGSWVSLVRSVAYEIRSGAPAAARANALVELADWHLLSTSLERRHLEAGTDRALEIYERAIRELQADANGRATEVFSPEVPVTLPTYRPNRFSSPANEESSRYLDVSFAVTQYGRAERIELLATSRGATRAEERDVIRRIEGTSFRPRVVDGKIAAAAPVVVRYALDR